MNLLQIFVLYYYCKLQPTKLTKTPFRPYTTGTKISPFNFPYDSMKLIIQDLISLSAMYVVIIIIILRSLWFHVTMNDLYKYILPLLFRGVLYLHGVLSHSVSVSMSVVLVSNTWKTNTGSAAIYKIVVSVGYYFISLLISFRLASYLELLYYYTTLIITLRQNSAPHPFPWAS
jgi:hypothetical protein